MKTLKDILTESILSSDDELDNRNLLAGHIKCFYPNDVDKLKKCKKENKNIIATFVFDFLRELNIETSDIDIVISYIDVYADYINFTIEQGKTTICKITYDGKKYWGKKWILDIKYGLMENPSEADKILDAFNKTNKKYE